MTTKTLYLTLALCSAIAFVLTLSIAFVLFGRSLTDQVTSSFLVSVPPALASLFVIRVTTFSISWLGAAAVYFVFFTGFVVVLGVVG